MSNSKTSPALPDYENPPVNEVICGLRFEPSDDFKLPHIGLLWSRIFDKYPKVQHATPIMERADQGVEDPVTGLPLPRVWLINSADDELIQIQRNRFYYNWRRREGVYPRYKTLVLKFYETFELFSSFRKELGIGKIVPLACELTYVNHIPKGEGWETIDDLDKIFTDVCWQKRERRFLPNPVNVGWNLNFAFPEQQGHLTVSLKQAVRITDKVPLLVLEMRCSGIPKSREYEDLKKWYDLAHEWIVFGFADITSMDCQKKIWGRKDV
jgi:uncharacterized protein (TIGR04255 family)